MRFPLNEASWLGYLCADVTGAMRDPDPGHNYQATVKKAVADATAAGLYVGIDLHWSAPQNFCPLAQIPSADASYPVLISEFGDHNAAGTVGAPTDGYGVYVKAHYLCVATGSSSCP